MLKHLRANYFVISLLHQKVMAAKSADAKARAPMLAAPEKEIRNVRGPDEAAL